MPLSKRFRSVQRAASRKMAPKTRFPIRTAVVAVGVAGLAALAIALIGPRRLKDDYLRPISDATLVPLASAVTPQAERAWAETRPWRDRMARIFSSINTEEVREAIAERLTHWVDRLR